VLQGDPGLTPAGRAWLDFLLGALGGHPSQQQGVTLANLPVLHLFALSSNTASLISTPAYALAQRKLQVIPLSCARMSEPSAVA